MDELVTSPNISPLDYRDVDPLFLFDVTKQSEKLKYSVTDIQIKANFSAYVNANTESYAVIISDKSLSFKSDGNKLSVVYQVKSVFSYIKMIKTVDLNRNLKENNIDFRSYWDKKQLIDLVLKHGLMTEEDFKP